MATVTTPPLAERLALLPTLLPATTGEMQARRPSIWPSLKSLVRDLRELGAERDRNGTWAMPGPRVVSARVEQRFVVDTRRLAELREKHPGVGVRRGTLARLEPAEALGRPVRSGPFAAPIQRRRVGGSEAADEREQGDAEHPAYVESRKTTTSKARARRGSR